MRNLSPFFSQSFDDVYNASTNPNGYWKRCDFTSGSLFYLGDGWVRVNKETATSGTSYAYFRPKQQLWVEANKTYTLMWEIRNANTSGTVRIYPAYKTSSALQQFNETYSTINVANGTFTRKLTGLALTTAMSVLVNCYVTYASNATGSFDLRMSIYDGEYTGEYVPYTSGNLTPFFSHDFADIYNAASNPNGYWYINPAYSSELGNVCTQLSDGWAHIEMDNSAKTTWAYLNIYLRPLAELKPNTEYTLLIELRNVTVGGTATDNTRYILLEQADTSTQISQTVNSSGFTDVTLNQDGTIYKALVTKPSFDGCTVFCRNTIRVGAGNTLSCDMRLSLYETTGENILLDTNAPTLTKINAPYDRYFSDAGNTAIVPTYGALTGAPYEYGAKFVYDGSYTNARRRGLGFYTGTTVGTIYYEAGKQYQATYWARCTSGKGYASVGFNNSTGAQSVVPQPTSLTAYAMTSEWRKYTVSVRPTVSGTWSRMWFFASFAANTAGTVEICGFSLREMTATYEPVHEYAGDTTRSPRVFVYSHEDKAKAELLPEELLDVKRTDTINGEHSLTITTPKLLEKEERILLCDTEGTWREYVVSTVTSTHDRGINAITEYYCMDAMKHDLSGVLIEDKRPSGSGAIALQAALSGTSRWVVGSVTTSTTSSASFYYISAWEALGFIVENWGGELRADITVSTTGVVTRKVSLLNQLGSSTATRRFEFTHDLASIQRKVLSDPVYCRVVPRGKGEETAQGGFGRRITIESVNSGKNYLEDSAAAAAVRLPSGSGYDYPTIQIVNEDIGTPAALKAWGQTQLPLYTAPRLSYAATVAQYGVAGVDANGVGLGDVIDVVDRTFYPNDELRLEARAVKIITDELDPARTELTIDNFAQTLTNLLTKLDKQVERTTEAVKEMNGGTLNTETYLLDLLGRINDVVNVTGGYTYIVQGMGLITYDVAVSDPTVGAEASQATEIRGGTIRIANSKDAQGNWEWRTVFTSGHIAGELVTAAQITTGYIGSSDGAVYINLDDRIVQLGSNNEVHQVITDKGQTLYDSNEEELMSASVRTGDIVVCASMYATGTSYTATDNKCWIGIFDSDISRIGALQGIKIKKYTDNSTKSYTFNSSHWTVTRNTSTGAITLTASLSNIGVATADLLYLGTYAETSADTGQTVLGNGTYYAEITFAYTGEAFVYTTDNSEATASGALAYGKETKSSGDSAASFGSETIAGNIGSFAVGESNTATGAYSFAGGYGSNAVGYYSLAFGNGARALRNYDVVFGEGTKSTQAGGSFILGKYNSVDNLFSFAIGDGTSDTNRFTSLGFRSGHLYIGNKSKSYSSMAPDVAAYAGINFQTGNYSGSYLRAYETGGTYGHNVILHTGGNLVMGGGEYSYNRFHLLDITTGENAYLGADGTVYIEANANTIGNRTTFSFANNLLTLKTYGIDASLANNGVSTTQYPTTYNVQDSAGRIISRKETVVSSNGNIGAYWYLRNYDTSGNWVAQKGINMTMNKSGNLTYSFSDVANARIALDLGSYTSFYEGWSYNNLTKPFFIWSSSQTVFSSVASGTRWNRYGRIGQLYIGLTFATAQAQGNSINTGKMDTASVRYPVYPCVMSTYCATTSVQVEAYLLTDGSFQIKAKTAIPANTTIYFGATYICVNGTT